MAKKRIQPKSPMQKYTLKDFQREFPNDGACLEWLKAYRWPDGITCENCGKVTKHHLMSTRRSFSCQVCGNHVHPTAGTIYHKSPTSLTTWFYAIYLMAQTRGGISAKQIQRETGVTYKTAWRMCHLIRQQLEDGNDPMSGKIETDESYFGGKMRGGKRGRGSENKTPVLGIVKRGGKIKTAVIPNAQAQTLIPLVTAAVEAGSTIFTDELPSYNSLGKLGYTHEQIPHALKIYAIGQIHTNTIEGFWGNTKGGIKGVYHHVSPKYLQNYLNEYGFRYSHRMDVTPMFKTFLSRTGVLASNQVGDSPSEEPSQTLP